MPRDRERCEHGDVYNVGADQNFSVQEVIEVISSRARTDFQIEQDPALMRACDEPRYKNREGHMDEIRGEIRRYIEDNFLLAARPAPLADTDSFLEHHVLDSTGFLELIGFLEERYGIRVADDEMVPENLDTLDSIVQYLARKRGA